MTTPTHDLVDRKIGRTVKALVAARAITVDDVASEIGISRGGLFAKIRGDAPFKAREVAALADYFGVTVADLYDGLADRLGVELPPDSPFDKPKPKRKVRKPVFLRRAHGFAGLALTG